MLEHQPGPVRGAAGQPGGQDGGAQGTDGAGNPPSCDGWPCDGDPALAAAFGVVQQRRDVPAPRATRCSVRGCRGGSGSGRGLFLPGMNADGQPVSPRE